MRVVGAVVLLCLWAGAAAGEPNFPEIAAGAIAYRKDVEGLSASQSAAQLLRAIKQAENASATAETIRLYEQLLALNGANFQAWYQLGLAWRSADESAQKRASQPPLQRLPDRPLRAQPDRQRFCLIASFLRTRLAEISAPTTKAPATTFVQ